MYKSLFLLLGSFLLFFSFIAIASASETQLLCLTNGQTVKFSECNPTIADRTCSPGSSCQYCVTKLDSGVYCPANINVCNSIANLSCSSLSNPPINTTNSTGNSTGLIATLGTPRIVLHASPGQTVQSSISVINDNDVPVTIDLTTSGVLANQLVLSQNNFILQPNEQKDLGFTIRAQNNISTTETLINVRFSAVGRDSVSLTSTIVVITSISAQIPKFDVAYILMDVTHPEQNVITALNQSGLSYNLIDDDSLPSTNFSEYNIVLVWNEKIKNPSLIPITKKKSIIANTYYLSDWKIADSAGTQSSSQPLKGQILISNLITSNLTSPVPLYTTSLASLHYVAKLPKRATSIKNVLGTNNFGKDVIIGFIDSGGSLYPSTAGNATAKTLFFGITESQYWTAESKQMFRNSIKWLMFGEDLDSDGYTTETDCNDKDPNINPGNPDARYNCINDSPVILSVTAPTVNATFPARIIVSASDPENDSLTYSISDSHFSKSGNVFTWNTQRNDFGTYNFIVTVSDSQFSVAFPVSLVISDYNRAPSLTQIPAISWDEDGNYTLDLNNYFSDLDSDLLIFGIENTSSNLNIQIPSIINGTVTFTSSANWFGSDWIVFYAFDGRTKTLSNLVNISVLSINDAPILTGNIGNLTWNEDAQFPNAIHLSNYFSDIDSQLTYTISGNENISVNISNNMISLSTPKDWAGEETIIITATDGEFSISSNPILLSVANMPEPPEFILPLNCDTSINEDEEHSCILDATDVENDTFNFSIGSSSHLQCSISGNNLTYISESNYNGLASCNLIVTDRDGSTSLPLQVSVLPINDAPVISSFTPTGAARVLQGTNKTFSIVATDIDSNPSISWLLDSQNVANTSSYNFQSAAEGTHTLEAIVSDSEFNDSHSWLVFTGDISKFTCSEGSGSVCSANQVCNGDILGVADSKSCCSIACSPKPPRFSDADACSPINKTLGITITSPTSSTQFKAGDEITAQIYLENKQNKSIDVTLEANIYNGDNEESLNLADTSVSLIANSAKTATLHITIPQHLDLEDKYYLYVKGEDNICNQAFIQLNMQRKDHDVVIDNFDLPLEASCSDLIKSSVRVKNIGLKDENLSISILSSDLKLSTETPDFLVEKYDGSNTGTRNFFLQMPDNIATGVYNITASVDYSGYKTKLVKQIKLSSCASLEPQQPILEQNSTLVSDSQIILGSVTQGSTTSGANGKSTAIVFVLMFLTTISTLVFVGFLYFLSIRR